tara:strand:+ start:23529 stop:24566 length:1038 start_codon:yes stop_codon:yes gene_type:complete
MSKNVHQDFDQLALQHFGLENAPQYGVCSNSAGDIETIIAIESKVQYDTIKDTIETPSTKKLGAWKRVFLLPKSPISIDRVRSALKEHGITLVSDLSAADAIICHNDFGGKFENGSTINSTTMMAKLWNYDTFKNSNGSMQSADNYYSSTNNTVIYDEKLKDWFNIYNISYDQLYDAWMLTGMAVNLAYKIAVESLPIITIEDVIYQSATKQILDEHLVQDIIRQIESYNQEDTAIVGKILPTIDYESNYHLLWKLAQEIDTHLYKFNRNKDVQYWKDQAKMEKLSYFSAEEMILWLEEKGKLSTENFRYLEPIVRREIRIENRDLYVFKIKVKPEYRQYLKNKK